MSNCTSLVALQLKMSDADQMIQRATLFNTTVEACVVRMEFTNVYEFMPKLKWVQELMISRRRWMHIPFHQHESKVELWYTVPKMRHVQPDSTNCHPAGACDGWATPTTVAKNTARGAQYTNTSWFEWAHHARLLSQTHFHTANGCSVQKLQNYCTVGTA